MMTNLETEYVESRSRALQSVNAMLSVIVPRFARELYGPAHPKSGLRVLEEGTLGYEPIATRLEASKLYSALERRAKSSARDVAWDANSFHTDTRVSNLHSATALLAAAEAVLSLERVLAAHEAPEHEHASVAMARQRGAIENAQLAMLRANTAVALAHG